MASYKAAFIADIHYFSPLLGTSGRAYELRSGSDQKCLAESGAVFDAAAEMLAGSGADCVCIAGDITNNGEKCSHDEMLAKLRTLREKRKVFLITSTHDWCSDGRSRRYEGEQVIRDVEMYTAPEVAEMYAPFGAGDELASFRTAKGFASRVFRLSDHLRLIAVNDDCDGRGGKSGYSPEHLAWMKEQIKKAAEENAFVIAMEHHLIMPCISPLVNSTQLIADWQETSAELADAGLRLMFTGHSHMQRTTEFVSPAGNRITQINLGSLCGYPAPVTFVTVDDSGKADVSVEFLDGFTYNGTRYGKEFFREHTSAVLYNLLNAAVADKNDLRDRLAADGIKIKNFDTVYPFIRAAAKKALSATVGGAARVLNVLTFGKAVDKNDVKAVKNEKLLPHIIDDFLNCFDGSFISRSQEEAVKRITVDVVGLPSRVVSHLPLGAEKKKKILGLTDAAADTARELEYPSAPDNMNCVIEL